MAKKIGAIVSMVIIGALIIATIVMANVNVNYSVNCATPTSVWVQYGANTERDAQGNADEIIEFIKNASNEKALTALFNGTLGKTAKAVTVSSVGKPLPSNSGFNIRFRYTNPQKMMNGKKPYTDNGKEVFYDDLVFMVKDVEGISVFNVYVIPDAEKATTYTHYYEVEADFTALYDFLVENNYNI